jgi:pimeloyl-ACP methyl ester carboxylesterase
MTEVLGQVNTPTLVICGQHDAISRVEEMRDIARQLPQAEFVEIPDAGHMAPLEKPELVNAAIRRFLQP